MPKSLGDIADLVMGFSPPGDTCNQSGIGVPLLNGPTEFGPHHPTPVQFTTEPRRFADPGDILFCVRGSTTGRMNWADQRYAIGRGIAAIRHRGGVKLQPYVRAAIECGLPKLLGFATGSTFPSLSREDIAGMPVPELDDDDATGISGLVGAFDDKIEHNRKTSRALEGLGRAMFKAWFVDFEPVHAKAAGATSFPGMPPEAFAALPTRFTDSPPPLGPVPEGWEVRPIGELVSVKGGATPSTKVAEYWDDGTHHWATPKDLSGLQDPVLLGTERQITSAGVECISSGTLPIDTVLLSSRAPVGYTALAKVPVAVNQGFIAMVCDGPLPPHYVLHWTRSVMEEIKSRASGTTFPEISKAGFRPIPAVVPNPPVAAAFESVVRGLFDLITGNARESRKLAELRDYLLPKLLSGAVRVGGAVAIPPT